MDITITDVFDELADSVFALRGIKVLLRSLANDTNDSNMTNALNLLSNDVENVEAKLDTVLKKQIQNNKEDSSTL